ncbi:hypothetical protein Mapa_004029 [Marchantia paleacea]|nr:hypothetical protein Mapa_004029 [Marchantia paleacea]
MEEKKDRKVHECWILGLDESRGFLRRPKPAAAAAAEVDNGTHQQTLPSLTSGQVAQDVGMGCARRHTKDAYKAPALLISSAALRCCSDLLLTRIYHYTSTSPVLYSPTSRTRYSSLTGSL